MLLGSSSFCKTIFANPNHIANLNPLRYRSYFYDSETGWYWLNTRYYNPEVGRFINADDSDLLGANGDITSLNLFAYCGNNPVNRSDENGEFWHILIGGAVGAIVGGVSAAIFGGDATDIIIGAVGGMVGGALAASGAGIVAQAIGSAAISMTSNATGQVVDIISNETSISEFDVGDMMFDGAIGFVCGVWGGQGASYGNVAGINSSIKQLGRHIKSKNGVKNAIKYFSKTAHSQGGDFFLESLSKSLAKGTVGAYVIDKKNDFRGRFGL